MGNENSMMLTINHNGSFVQQLVSALTLFEGVHRSCL